MTPRQVAVSLALEGCSVGNFHLRFVEDMARIAHKDPDAAITEKQNDHLEHLAHHYREQISDGDIDV